MNSAEPQEAASQLQQPEVVLPMFVITHQQCPAFTEPTQGPLHHPPPRLVTLLPVAWLVLLADTAAVRRVTPRGRRLPPGWVVIALVQAQILSITPLWHQRWNQRWMVRSEPNSLGRRFHWQPLRRRWMMPLNMVRQSLGGCPPLGLGCQSSRRIGSMRAQRSSETSQMVS